jgi:hypothetical protein
MCNFPYSFSYKFFDGVNFPRAASNSFKIFSRVNCEINVLGSFHFHLKTKIVYKKKNNTSTYYLKTITPAFDEILNP